MLLLLDLHLLIELSHDDIVVLTPCSVGVAAIAVVLAADKFLQRTRKKWISLDLID
jgi:hypothetical protein